MEIKEDRGLKAFVTVLTWLLYPPALILGYAFKYIGRAYIACRTVYEAYRRGLDLESRDYPQKEKELYHEIRKAFYEKFDLGI